MARPDTSQDEGSDEDADALSWAGDEERGRDAPRLRDLQAEAAVAPDGDVDEPEVPGARARAVATGAFALPYLAWTIGWIYSVQQASAPSAELLTQVLWQFGEFLAMLSAPLWFGATLSLTRASRPLVRVGWLALGLGVLLPWPFVVNLILSIAIAGSPS